MKKLSYVVVSLGLSMVAGCQTTPQPTSNRQKVVSSLKEVKLIHDNRANVSCTRLDSAMARSYSVARLFTDKRVSKGEPTKKAQLLSLQFQVYYDDLEQEYLKRCDGDPILTKAMKASYNDIVRKATKKS